MASLSGEIYSILDVKRFRTEIADESIVGITISYKSGIMADYGWIGTLGNAKNDIGIIWRLGFMESRVFIDKISEDNKIGD